MIPVTRPDAAQATTDVPRALPVLAALVTLVVTELIRSSGPLLDMAFTQGVTAAAGSALLTYAAPGVIALALVVATRRAAPGTAILVAVVLLGVGRLVAQGLTAGARFGVGLLTVAIGIAVLTMVVALLAGRPGGGRAAAAAVAAGIAGSIGVHLALSTWDAYWRPGVLGWAVAVVVVAATVVTAGLLRATALAPGTRAGRVWTLGPVLGLAVMVLANPAFLAAQADVPVAAAGAALGAGWLLAALAARDPGPWAAGWNRWAAVAGFPLLVAALALTTTPVALLPALALPLVAAEVMAQALEPHTRKPPRTAWVAGASALVGLGVILPLLVYQLDYDVPLGFPNWIVLVVAALVAGTGTLRTLTPAPDSASAARPPSVPVLAAGALVLVGVVVGTVDATATARALEHAGPPPDELTLVSWNLHYGVDPAGDVSLEEIARTIAEHEPDVVALQEVSRGWVMGGGVDMATWLAQRLDMHLTFAPAADRQFGNAVLTARPHEGATVIELPYGDGPQHRSAITVDVDAGGTVVRLTSVHVQHRAANTPNRLDQLRTVRAAESSAAAWVLAGDINAEPGSVEIDLLTADMVSALDVAGDPAALTHPSVDPQVRIDWVLGRGVTFTMAAVLDDALASDHLPLVVSLRPTDAG